MKVSRKWIDWAHGPGAEDGQPRAMTLCDLASSPDTGAVCISDPALIAELVDIAELYFNPCAGDALSWPSQQGRTEHLRSGRSLLRQSAMT